MDTWPRVCGPCWSAFGLTEALTHSLAAPSAFDDPREESRRVTIRQALSAELSGLRQSLIPNLLEVLARNLRQRQPDVQMFEVGKVFARGEADGQYVETRRVAAVLTGPMVDFFTAKGLVESLAAALSLPACRLCRRHAAFDAPRPVRVGLHSRQNPRLCRRTRPGCRQGAS